MTLDAILLALAGILSNNKRGVAILPEVRIAQGDGIQISHPISGYELWLTGNADYAVIKYDDVRDYKGGCGHYTLSLYQYDEYTSSIISGRGAYLALPWLAPKNDPQSASMATLKVGTYLCSTKYSQDPTLLGLLKWKNEEPGSLPGLLKLFPSLPLNCTYPLYTPRPLICFLISLSLPNKSYSSTFNHRPPPENAFDRRKNMYTFTSLRFFHALIFLLSLTSFRAR